MRIIVTASRTYDLRENVFGALDLLAEAARASRETLSVAHGACPEGGDQIADDWVTQRKLAGWPVERQRYPADWKRYSKRAGFLRNTQMVRDGADACLAFVDPCSDSRCKRTYPHGSHGATHCATEAEAAGIPTQWLGRFVDGPAEPMPDEVA